MSLKLPPVDHQWLASKLPPNIRCDGVCGAGGMGVVFRAFHLDWSIPLAIKVQNESAESGSKRGFLAEAEAWADLGLHPYVATLYYVRDLGGKPCAISELVEAGGMDGLLKVSGHRGADPQTTLSRFLTLAASTAWGLGAAHEIGLVHCDFKPGNCLVGAEFTAKVTDFGLARRMIPGGFPTPGATPLYESPEQARREKLDQATDFWSWAATCFEMFIGGATWSSGAAAGHAFEEFMAEGGKHPGYPKIPHEIEEILKACFARNPRERPNSFHEIAHQILQVYEEIFDEPCPASEPDPDLIAADSLNNRAVSLLDLGEINRATDLLERAWQADPLHPEAAFNLFLLTHKRNPSGAKQAEQILRACIQVDRFNPVPHLLLAKVLYSMDKGAEAETCLAEYLRQMDLPDESREALRNASLTPVLARPMAGDDLAHHKERFHRLISKANGALQISDVKEASRYALMAGDIPGFARHPELQKVRNRIRDAS